MKNNFKKGDTKNIKGGKFELIHPRKEVEQKYLELAHKIKKDFSGKEPPMIIRIVPEGHYSNADLTRTLASIGQDFETDIIVITDDKTKHPILQYPTKDIKERHIILLQNIVATGKTLSLVKELLLAFQVDQTDQTKETEQTEETDSISFFALGWKRNLSEINFGIDYVGFLLENNHYIGEGGGKYDFDQALLGLWKKIN